MGELKKSLLYRLPQTRIVPSLSLRYTRYIKDKPKYQDYSGALRLDPNGVSRATLPPTAHKFIYRMKKSTENFLGEFSGVLAQYLVVRGDLTDMRVLITILNSERHILVHVDFAYPGAQYPKEFHKHINNDTLLTKPAGGPAVTYSRKIISQRLCLLVNMLLFFFSKRLGFL